MPAKNVNRNNSLCITIEFHPSVSIQQNVRNPWLGIKQLLLKKPFDCSYLKKFILMTYWSQDSYLDQAGTESSRGIFAMISDLPSDLLMSLK